MTDIAAMALATSLVVYFFGLLGLFIVVRVIRWAWGSSTTTITINNSSSDKPKSTHVLGENY